MNKISTYTEIEGRLNWKLPFSCVLVFSLICSLASGFECRAENAVGSNEHLAPIADEEVCNEVDCGIHSVLLKNTLYVHADNVFASFDSLPIRVVFIIKDRLSTTTDSLKKVSRNSKKGKIQESKPSEIRIVRPVQKSGEFIFAFPFRNENEQLFFNKLLFNINSSSESQEKNVLHGSLSPIYQVLLFASFDALCNTFAFSGQKIIGEIRGARFSRPPPLFFYQMTV